MINTEIELILKWTQSCVLTGKSIRQRLAADGDLEEDYAINRPKNLKFNITDCKLYVPVVPLEEKYDNELLEGLKNRINIDSE